MKMINRLLNRILPCCATFLLIVAATPAYGQDTAPPARDERALTPALRVRLGAGAWTTDSFWSDAETRIRTFPV
jgi:hypothetical protein